jgi:hypothetical protein
LSRTCRDDIVAKGDLATPPEESAEGIMDVPAQGLALNPKGGVSVGLKHDVLAEPSINERRLVVLRSLLDRWIAEHPAVLAVDAERAQEHQQAITSIRQMIASLEAGAERKASSEPDRR